MHESLKQVSFGKRVAIISFFLLFINGITTGIAARDPNGRTEFFISNLGDDGNDGSLSYPFASLEKARDTVRKILKYGIKDTIIIYLREGTYYLKESFTLNNNDGGNEFYPVIYSAYGNETVRLSGGIAIPVEYANKISGKSVLPRLAPGMKEKILQIDLKELHLLDYGRMRPRGFRRPYFPSAMELFINDEPMTLARWPNDRLEPIGKVVEKGSDPREGDYSGKGGAFSVQTERLIRWKKAGDLWVYGFFHYGYADDALRVSKVDAENRIIYTVQPTMYGFADGNVHLGWYAFNLLEEIDQPGEYYMDREKGILYFYPEQKDLKSIEVSMLESPMVAMENCSFIHFRNIRFECARGMGMYIEGGRCNAISGCEFKNLGLMAVSIGKGIKPFEHLMHDGTGIPVSRSLGSWHEHIYANTTFNREAGHDHLIRDCHIYNTGSGGISLSGGNRLTLEKGRNRVENCFIHDFNRLDRTYRAGINIDGVGNIIRHCEIAYCPASAIYLHGNDHLIEFNEIHHAVMAGDDMGAVYFGRDPSEYGTVIRNNLFHHIGSGDLKAGHRKIIAIYHDDGACGLTVTGNIFYKAGSRVANIGGGNDNKYINNVFIDGKIAVHHDNRLQGWASYMCSGGGIFEQRLEAVHYQEPPYSKAYPELVNYFTDRPGLPKRNIIQYNLFIGFDVVYSGKPEYSGFGKNLILCKDPGFRNIEGLDFRLDPRSGVFELMPEFEVIPVLKIGRMTIDE